MSADRDQSPSIAAPTYRGLLIVPSFPPLAATMLLAQMGGNAWNLVLILFVLDRFHSPQLAGLAAFFGVAPGLLASPLAGALLDRSRRTRLVAIDMAIGALTTAVIALLAVTDRLSSIVLVAVVTTSSLTSPLTMGGFRTLVPALVPRPLWDKANVVMSSIGNLALLVGPAWAGALVAAAGGTSALLVIGAMWLLGAGIVLFVREPRPESAVTGGIVRSAWEGLRYLIENPTLRGLSVVMPLTNMGFGAFVVALPVLVLRMHGSAAEVGVLWSVFAAAALITSILFGHVRSEGRERPILAATLVAYTAALFLAAVAVHSTMYLPLLGACMVLAGGADGPLLVTLISLRQRATDPAQFGRALSTSGSISYLGIPIGSALAGAAIPFSLQGTMAGTAVCTALAGVLVFPLLPRHTEV